MNQKSRLTTAAEIAAILGTIITYLAFAYIIGWWPFPKDAQKTPEVGLIAPNSPTPTLIPKIQTPTTSMQTNAVVPTATFTPKPTDITRPTSTSTQKPTDTPRPIATPTLVIGSSKISPIDGAVMMYVPAGEFLMGGGDADKEARDNEKPQRTVYLDAFWIDKYEVTNALYKKCVSAGKCQPPNPTKSYTRDAYYGNSQYDNYPVIYVSWDSANTFCSWANKKLPTEAQWEKVASWDDAKKEKRIYPWGNAFDGTRVNFCDSNCQFDWKDKNVNDGYADTSPVGNYASGASFYGVVDMAGNVWEWVADWYDANYYKNSPSRNPTGASSGNVRVVRGGSWHFNADYVRAANRLIRYPGYLDGNLGFRCVE